MREIYREPAPRPPDVSGNDGEGRYRLTVEERPLYTYACIQSADAHFRPTVEHLERILKQCSITDCERLIIENRSCRAFSRVDFLQTATQFPGYGLSHTRVAVVDAHDADGEIQRLNIVIGKLSSISVRVFPHITDAEAWIVAH